MAEEELGKATGKPDPDAGKPKSSGGPSKISGGVTGAIKNPKKAAGTAAIGAAEKAAGAAMSDKNRERVEKVQDVASKAAAVKGGAVATAGAAKATGGAIVALVSNPVGWIILAIFLIIVLVFSGMQVLGQTDNADGCYGIGESGDSVEVGESSDDWLENGNTIADWLTSTSFDSLDGQPMTEDQAGAVVGNMRQESVVDPKSTQGGSTSSDTSNQEIIDLGEAKGKAIGLLQLDSDRRLAFAKWAEEKGKHWSDFGLQLEWLKMELEGTTPTQDPTYNRDQTLAQGFADEGKEVAFYTEAWEKGFTRAGKPNMPKRIAYAEEFLAQYSSGSGSGVSESSSGGSCQRQSSGSVDASDLVELAVSMSYPTSEESKVSGGDSYGESIAKQEYKDAKAEAEKLGDGADPLGNLYASCDRFVATVIRLTADEDIPWGDTSTQQQYLDGSNKWERYESKSEAQPGDIWVTQTGGHIILYLGDVDGEDTIAHASYLDRVAALGGSDYLNESLVDTGGRAYYGYRFVG